MVHELGPGCWVGARVHRHRYDLVDGVAAQAGPEHHKPPGLSALLSASTKLTFLMALQYFASSAARLSHAALSRPVDSYLLTTSVTLIVTFGLMPLLAVNVMGYWSAEPVAGLPLIAPVLGFNSSPSGSFPALKLTVGGGVPVRIGL